MGGLRAGNYVVTLPRHDDQYNATEQQQQANFYVLILISNIYSRIVNVMQQIKKIN